jgi:O-antigen/teichoic acid export membrane protein
MTGGSRREWRRGPRIVSDTLVEFDPFDVIRHVPRDATPQRWFSGVKAAWHKHHELLHNAGTLVATTGVTSVMGFAYWAIAARLFSQREIGYGSAAVSAMTVLGTIGMFGLGTLLIGELPRRRRSGELVAAALLVSGLGSLVLGLGFAVIAPNISGRFEEIAGNPVRTMLFAAGVALTGMTLVFDMATIGLLRGGLQLTRNMAFTAAKLLALPVAVISLHEGFGIGITASWVAGMFLSVMVVAISLRSTGVPALLHPDWEGLKGLGKTVMAHNWLNLAISLPYSLMPVLVAVVVSPSANAAFYVAWMLSSFLYVVPAHLSTVLFAVVSSNQRLMARKLRFTLSMSILIGLPGMAILGVGAHLALSMFGANYASVATLPMRLLVLAYLPTISNVHYVAVCRASGRISRAAAVLTIFGALEIAAAVLGGVWAGLNGLSLGILAVLLVEGIVITPTILRAAVGNGRHRRAASKGGIIDIHIEERRTRGIERAHPGSHLHVQQAPQDPHGFAQAMPSEIPMRETPMLADASQRARQYAGIAALLSLASSLPSTIPIPVVPARPHPGARGTYEERFR